MYFLLQIEFLCPIRLKLYSCAEEFAEPSVRFFGAGAVVAVEDRSEDPAFPVLYFVREDACAEVPPHVYTVKKTWKNYLNNPGKD